MSSINAKELKMKGLSAIEAALTNDSVAAITVGGKNRFVVMSLEHFCYLRGCELEAALATTKENMSDKPVCTSSVEEHIERVKSQRQ